MGRMRQLQRQGDLLALMERGPALPKTVQAAAIPLLAALLLEMAEAELRAEPEDAAMSGGRHEQDRA
jgi:hypothetical protein